MSILSNKNLRNIFFLSIFGYYIYSPFLYLVDAENPIISAILRILILLILIIYTFKNFAMKIKIESLIFLAVTWLINAKLFLECANGDISSNFYFVHLISIALPVSIITLADTTDVQIINKNTSQILKYALIANIVSAVHNLYNDPIKLLSGRLEHSYLNANSMGMLAVSVFIFGIICNGRKSFLSVSAIMLANSRQSIIAFLLALIYFLPRLIILNFRKIIALIALSVGTLTIYIMYVNGTSFDVIERVYSITSSSEISVTSRLTVYMATLNEIATYPWLGGDFNNGKGGFPHNLVLELFSGLGIFLGLLILLIIYLGYIKIKYIHGGRILLIVFFLSSMVSGGLYSYNELFLLVCIGLKGPRV